MYRDYKKFLCACVTCGQNTSKSFARAHAGQCKQCAEPETKRQTPGERSDLYNDWVCSGARAAGVSFSDC
jgi:hypothetical protein